MKNLKKSEEYGFQLFQGFCLSLLIGIIYLSYLGVSSIYNYYQEKQEMEIAYQARKEAEIKATREAEIRAVKERSEAQEFAKSCDFDYNSFRAVKILDLKYEASERNLRDGYLFENDNEYFINGVVISKADFYPSNRYNSIVILKDGKRCPSLLSDGSFVVQYPDERCDVYITHTR